MPNYNITLNPNMTSAPALDEIHDSLRSHIDYALKQSMSHRNSVFDLDGYDCGGFYKFPDLDLEDLNIRSDFEKALSNLQANLEHNLNNGVRSGTLPAVEIDGSWTVSVQEDQQGTLITPSHAPLTAPAVENMTMGQIASELAEKARLEAEKIELEARVRELEEALAAVKKAIAPFAV